MRQLAHIFSYHFPNWNKEIIKVDEIHKFCEQGGARIIETDLIEGLGEYRVHREQFPVILIHQYIKRAYYWWVLYHETAHFMLHPIAYAEFSDHNHRRKIEKEANFFAACALIPLPLLQEFELWQIEETFGYPRKLVLIRKKIFDDYGI